MKKVTAVYAGSFDPVTLGHVDIIKRAASMFENVIVAIGVNPNKKPLFSTEEKTEMISNAIVGFENVCVDSFEGLLIEYCKAQEARVIIRGLRAVSDFEQELTLAHANGDLAPQLETVWLPTKPHHSFVSSSMVREIASHKGDVGHYVSPYVKAKLKEKFFPKPLIVRGRSSTSSRKRLTFSRE